MHYKREEAFRYTFEDPIEAKFKIVGINGTNVDTQEGEIRILDISLEGMKIETHLDIPLNAEITVFIIFEIIDEIGLPGQIVWKDTFDDGNRLQYGLSLHTSEQEKAALIENLKTYSRESK
jgi:hypothetical protein